ncbi:hypothetical protein H9Y04_04205 [Streptomyces sp. TRM66268-LWL]|uniref:Uncharacterized protein n=1 Tax=Streptomyces polyasparticus TaxID=2767826 RepID=A0ABR7S8I0_9ACTN|nr:hypothetical protein [Streptomyces polyasparticus]MBC9711771.1 hypothetical protein [Streptomyces polyasparticus]
MSGSTEFDENGFGSSQAFSLDRVVEQLHSGPSSDPVNCYVSDAERNGKPLLDIEFEAIDHHPTPDPEGADARNEYEFPMGKFAAVGETGGARIYFACPTEGPDGKRPFVKASLYSVLGPTDESMTILNSVSRRLAETIGCTDVASLPGKVPAPVG